MTDILLRYPMQAFLIGLLLQLGTVAWLLYLIRETVRQWHETRK